MRVLWYVDLPPQPLAMRTAQAVSCGPISWAESLRGVLEQLPGLKLGIVSAAPVTLPSHRRRRHHVPCSPWAATRGTLGVSSKAMAAPVRACVARTMLTLACAES